MTYDEIRQRVGFRRGFPKDPADCDADQLQEIEFAVRDGARMFYTAYDWSFLKPTKTMTILSGTRTLQMPDDFANLFGDIQFTSTDTPYWYPLEIDNDEKVRLAFQLNPNLTSRPRLVSLRTLANPQVTIGSRME